MSAIRHKSRRRHVSSTNLEDNTGVTGGRFSMAGESTGAVCRLTGSFLHKVKIASTTSWGHIFVSLLIEVSLA